MKRKEGGEQEVEVRVKGKGGLPEPSKLPRGEPRERKKSEKEVRLLAGEGGGRKSEPIGSKSVYHMQCSVLGWLETVGVGDENLGFHESKDLSPRVGGTWI